jgi:hypothetical protein
MQQFAADGYYCGITLNGDPTMLYHCVGKATLVQGTERCGCGCQINPGKADNCKLCDLGM